MLNGKVETISAALRRLALMLEKDPAKSVVVLLETQHGSVEILTLGALDQFKVLGLLQFGIHEITHPHDVYEEDEPEEKARRH